MKKKYYDAGTYIYMANQKRGTELIIAGAIAGAASLAASGINAASQSSANSTNMQLNKDTLEEQKALFHEANQFNHNEAQIARQFNAQESQIARQFNAQEAETNRQFQAGMIQKYMDYNSPSAQFQRYVDAGLNPASLAGNVNNQGFSIPSGSSASSSPVSVSPASAAGVPSLSTAHVNPVNYGDIVGNALNAAGGFLGLKEKGEDIKGKVTDNEFKEALYNADIHVKNAEANLLYQQHLEISSKLEKTKTEIQKLTAEIGLVNKQGQWYDKQGELIDEQRLSYAIDNIFKGEHWQQIIRHEAAQAGLTEMQAKWYSAFIQSEIAKNYGAAAYSNSLSALTAVETEFKKAGMQDELNLLKETRNYYENTNDILGIEKRVKRATEGKMKEETIKALEYQNSLWNRGADFMGKIMSTVLSAGMLYYGAKGFRGAGVAPKGFTPYKGFNSFGQ